jgi:hypothetical protein
MGGGTMSYWVIDSEAEKIGAVNIFGPFENRSGAEAFIRKDFSDWWQNSDTPLSDRDDLASGTYLILEQKAEVRPVGKHQLKVQLVEEKK